MKKWCQSKIIKMLRVSLSPSTPGRESNNLEKIKILRLVTVLFSRYKRIFSVGTMGITTYNPSSLDVTNRWAYSDFVSLQPQKNLGTTQNEFVITMRKEKKLDHMKFSTEHRTQLMTEALKFRHCFAEKPREILVSWSVVFFCQLGWLSKF